MSEELQREEVHEAVDRAVLDLLSAADITQPPVNAIALAHHLGVDRGVDRTKKRRGRPEPSAEQQQWAVAHVIGEHIKPDLLRRLGIDPEQPRAMFGESLANLFANRLLVPTVWLCEEARTCGYDLLAIKERFSTASHEGIAWRLLDLPDPCIITIIDNDHVSRRRSNGPRVGKALSAPERRCQRQVHRHGQPHEVNEDGWRVQGWPVPQAEWKREILRSVPEDCSRISPCSPIEVEGNQWGHSTFPIKPSPPKGPPKDHPHPKGTFYFSEIK